MGEGMRAVRSVQARTGSACMHATQRVLAAKRGPDFRLPRESCIFAPMFDGTPIPPSAYDAAGPLWLVLVVIFGLSAGLRSGFGKEWACITRAQFLPWRDGGTADHREGGTWLVLLLGASGWMLAGTAWLWSRALPGEAVEWSSLATWFGIGVGTEALRAAGARFGAWLTLREDLLLGMHRMDRRLRVWWTWITALFWVGAVAQLPAAEALRTASGGVVWVWMGWLGVKWGWALVRLIRERVNLGWGFAYLCTLEIIPSAGLAWFVWKVCT